MVAKKIKAPDHNNSPEAAVTMARTPSNKLLRVIALGM